MERSVRGGKTDYLLHIVIVELLLLTFLDPLRLIEDATVPTIPCVLLLFGKILRCSLQMPVLAFWLWWCVLGFWIVFFFSLKHIVRDVIG